MIIKFWDNENYEYPLMDIWEEDLPRLKLVLKEYQKKDDYNWEEFLDVLHKEKIQFSILDLQEDTDLFF